MVKEILFLAIQPVLLGKDLAFWAVAVVAGVVGYLLVATGIAAVNMGAKGGCSAVDDALAFMIDEILSRWDDIRRVRAYVEASLKNLLTQPDK